MTPDEPEDSGVRVRIRGRELSFALTEQQADRARELARTALHEPFTKRVWSELAFFLLSAALAGAGLAFVSFTMVAGLFLAITFFGLAVLALSLRSARGIGGFAAWPGAQHARRGRWRTPNPSPGGTASWAGSSHACATAWPGGPWATSP